MAKYTKSTKIKDLLADARAVEIAIKYLGESTMKNPLIDIAKPMSLLGAMKHSSQIGLSKLKADALIHEILSLE